MTAISIPDVHPTAIIDQSALISEPPEDRSWREGDMVYAPEICQDADLRGYVTVDCGVKRRTHIGAGTLVMKKAHVGHDAIVGQGCDIGSLAIIGGYAEIGDGVKVGIGAIVLPFRKVGAGATIGAGAVVTKDVPAGETWAGNPARRLERNPVPYTERTSLTYAEVKASLREPVRMDVIPERLPYEIEASG